MSVRAIIVQYIGDTLFLPSFERKVNHIIVHNDNGGEEWEPIEFIVNCKNCKYGHKTDNELLNCIGPLTTSWDYYYDDFKENLVEPDGFCAWGERRDSDD